VVHTFRLRERFGYDAIATHFGWCHMQIVSKSLSWVVRLPEFLPLALLKVDHLLALLTAQHCTFVDAIRTS